MLLCFPDVFRADEGMERDVHGAVDFMLGLQQINGNLPPAMDEVGQGRRAQSDELVHWCHGAPGEFGKLSRGLGGGGWCAKVVGCEGCVV